MKNSGTSTAVMRAASCIASVRPRLRAAFLLALALLWLATTSHAQTTPVFLNWPTAITNFYTNVQVAYTNGPSVPGNPNMVFSPPAPNVLGLPTTGVSGPVTVQAAPGTSFTNGFGVVANAGQSSPPDPIYILLLWTNGTTPPVAPYTNTIQVTLNNTPAGTSASTNIDIVTVPQIPFRPYLGITFTNYDSSYAYTNLSNVWLSFATNPQSTPITIGYISNSTTNVTWSSGNVMSDPVALSTVNANGGLAFTNGSSVIGYLSYGGPLGTLTNSPSPVNSNDSSYYTPWVQFELTRGGTAAGLLAGDVGDLTFINEFSAPLYIKSYDTNGNPLQYTGFFSNSTATILQSLAALTQTNSKAVITNNSGQYVRVIAPVSFSNLVGPYDDFHTYITNLAAGSKVANLQNFSAFPVNGNPNTNILFRFTMTNHFKSDGTMEIKGIVTASNTVAPYTPASNFNNLKILYATNANSTVTDIGGAIYGANFASAGNTIFFVDADEGQTGAGANWLAMSNWMVAQYGNNPPNQTGANAYYTVLAQMVGEVSATIESGLAGSTNIVSNGSVSGVLGTNLSANWWTMTNPLSIMRNAQTNPLNYNQYGDVIFYYSSNSVYNFSYNDRYNNAKPVVFANLFNGTNVGAWVIGVGAPVSAVSNGPPPPPYLSYSGWVGAWALSPAISGGTADPDGDGFDNNKEYAFGGNPTNPTPYLLNISGSNISYLGLTNNAVPSPYTVQNTTNLATGPWTNYAVTVSNATDQLNIPLPAYYQRKQLTVPLTPGTNNFYRVIFSNR